VTLLIEESEGSRSNFALRRKPEIQRNVHERFLLHQKMPAAIVYQNGTNCIRQVGAEVQFATTDVLNFRNFIVRVVWSFIDKR
jgi:hypothetical protein